MEFDIDLALEEDFPQDPAAVAETVAWNRVQIAVEKLKRRIIPRDKLLQQNRDYKKMLKEYEDRVKIMTEEHQALLVEKTNTLEKYLKSEMMCEQSKLKVNDMEVNLNEANLSTNALTANIRQLQELIENKDVEILGLRTELKLQQHYKPPDVPTKSRNNKILLKHLQMFAEAAEKKVGLNCTLKRLLKTYYKRKGKDSLPESDIEEECVNNHIYTGPLSVDTGRGSSLASSDDEKVEHFLSEPFRTPSECKQAVISPICSPSSSTAGIQVSSDILSRNSAQDQSSSPIRLQCKDVSTSPIRTVHSKYTEFESEDDVFKLIKPMHTNVVPTSPMPDGPQDNLCPCGKECRLTNNCLKPIQKTKFELKTNFIERKTNKLPLRFVIKSHIDKEIKSQLEKKLKRKVYKQKSNNCQVPYKDSVYYSSEQVAHLLLTMGRAQKTNLENDTVVSRKATWTQTRPDINMENTQPVICQMPQNLQLYSTSPKDFEVTSLEKCDTSENDINKNNDIFIEKIPPPESAHVKPFNTLIEKDDSSSYIGSKYHFDTTEQTMHADNRQHSQSLNHSCESRSKLQIFRKQPVTKLENLRNKLSKKSVINRSDSSPPAKKIKIKSSIAESQSTAPQNLNYTPVLPKSLDAYQKAVEVMARINNEKLNKSRSVNLKKIGLSVKKDDKKAIDSFTNESCDRTRPESNIKKKETIVLNIHNNDSYDFNSPCNGNNVNSDLKRKRTSTNQFISKLCYSKSSDLHEVCTPNVQGTTVKKSFFNLERPLQSNEHTIIQEKSPTTETKNEKTRPDFIESQDIAAMSIRVSEAAPPISYEDLSVFDVSVKPALVGDTLNTAFTPSSPSTTIPYFLQIIERHAQNKGRKKMVTDESVNAKLVEQVTEYISSALTQSADKAHKTLDKLMEQLQKKKYKAAIGALIEFLCKAKNSDLECRGATPPAPPTSASERAVLYLVQRLRVYWPRRPVIATCLSAIEYKLFRLRAAPPCCHVENLSRFYALICRITKDISRLRIFLIDAVYCLTIKSIFAVMSVLDVWCHVLPLGQQQLANDPLVFSIIHLLHFTQGDNDIISKMRERLFKKFGYQPGDCNQQELLTKLGAFIKDLDILKTSNSLYIAFLLVGKRYGPAWCHTHLLKGLLLPILEKRGLRGPGYPARVLAARLLGPLVRPFPADMHMQSQLIRKRLIDIIYCGDLDILKTSNSLYIAFLLVGKRYGPAWCHTHLLKGLLLPILEKRGLRGPGYPARVLAARLLGPLVRPFPADMHMQSQLIRKRLIDIIYCGDVEVEVEFGALQSALVVCAGVALDSLLATWQPRVTPPLALRSQLRRHVKGTSLKVWQNKYALRFEGNCSKGVL